MISSRSYSRQLRFGCDRKITQTVERIALAQLSLFRCDSLEIGLTFAAMNETIRPDGFPATLLIDTVTHGIAVDPGPEPCCLFRRGL